MSENEIVLVGISQNPLKAIREKAKKEEAELSLRTLDKYNWNRTKAAKDLGIGYKALVYKLKNNPFIPQVRTEMSNIEKANREIVFESEDRKLRPLKEVGKRAKAEAEKEALLYALKIHSWNRKATAEALNISYKGILLKIKVLDLGQTPRT